MRWTRKPIVVKLKVIYGMFEWITPLLNIYVVLYFQQNVLLFYPLTFDSDFLKYCKGNFGIQCAITNDLLKYWATEIL